MAQKKMLLTSAQVKSLTTACTDLGFRLRIQAQGTSYRATVSISGLVNNIWWNSVRQGNYHVLLNIFRSQGWLDVEVIRSSSTSVILKFGDFWKILCLNNT